MVEAQIGYKILAFTRYKSPSLKYAPKINVWYPGMGEWCRICFAEGHRASACPKRMCNMEGIADEFKEMTEWKELMDNLKSEYGDRIEPFFMKSDPLCNHFLCEVKVDEVTYKSMEHCLFTKRALFCNDPKAAEEIEAADTSAKAMKRGQRVVFPGGRPAWHTFAKNILEKVNHAKFTQNAQLRSHLFGTCGRRLVEASTDDVAMQWT